MIYLSIWLSYNRLEFTLNCKLLVGANISFT